MTFKELFDYGYQNLINAGIEESRNDAFLLLEFACDLSRTAYLMKMNENADEARINLYKACIERRCNREPVQHITGHQVFMGIDFKVNKHVLIPRQDTEVVVEEAIKLAKTIQKDKVHILDVCTGSGCIAITVDSLVSNSVVTALDISEEALKVAKENNESLKANVTFVQSDLLENIDENQKFDMIISNPPYIRSKVVDGLMPEVRDFEPRLALDGTEDGLFFYRKISEEACRYLVSGGVIVYEIGHDQGEEVSEILRKNKFIDIRVGKDLAGLDRVVTARLL